MDGDNSIVSFFSFRKGGLEGQFKWHRQLSVRLYLHCVSSADSDYAQLSASLRYLQHVRDGDTSLSHRYHDTSSDANKIWWLWYFLDPIMCGFQYICRVLWSQILVVNWQNCLYHSTTVDLYSHQILLYQNVLCKHNYISMPLNSTVNNAIRAANPKL